MKALIFTLIIISNCICALSQNKEPEAAVFVEDSVVSEKNKSESLAIENDNLEKEPTEINRFSFGKPEMKTDKAEFFKLSADKTKFTEPFFTKKNPLTEFEPNAEMEKPDDDDKNFDSFARTKEKFHWKPALIESGIFLGVQHAFRMTQKKTRRELDGPFFRDWGRSVRSLNGWSDGNKFFTNYIAHPMQGGVTGRIFINNSDRAKKQEFGKSRAYWETRFKAMVWSAVWSTQFEIGPVSEATLGNVGILGDPRYNKMAWVDFVITPTLGTAWVVAEDALDKYVMKNWLEQKTSNKTMIKVFRIVFTPTASFANILRGKMPWYREERPLHLRNSLFTK
jgi:hypothetical protein